MMMFPRRIAFALACFLSAPLSSALRAATDDLADDFNRPDGGVLGLTSAGAYPWGKTPAPDGVSPALSGGQLVFTSTRAEGGSGTGIGPMAASVGRLFIEDVRIGFDLSMEATNGSDDQWVGLSWRQVGMGFDLSGYAFIVRPDGVATFFSPSLGSVLYQGNIGAFGPGVTRRIEVESVGATHRLKVDGTQLFEIQDASTAYAHVSFITLHPDSAMTPGTFTRRIDNLVIENLREFGPGFPRLRASDSEMADRLNRLYAYHYGYVLNPGPVRGVQQVNWREWNALSTLFVDTAANPSGPHDLNAELRQNLLSIPLDDEGYVFTYDPASPAGEFFPTIGWPFPDYANSGNESNRELGRRGKAYLWDQRSDTVGWSASGAASSTPGVSGWRVVGTDEVTVTSPAITGNGTFLSPWSPYRPMETFHSPYLALLGVPTEYEVEVNWRLQGQASWLPENSFISPPPASSQATNRYLPMYRHDQWYGASETNRNVVQLRLILRRTGGGAVDVTLRRLQSHYDTRQSTNNSTFVLASSRYYNWTGDDDFLLANLPRMRAAMEHMHAGLSGAALGLLEVNYLGHDGRPSAFGQDWGRGIGSNYYDLLPFGHRDAYGTAYYLGAVKAMAAIEAHVAERGGLGLPAPQRSAEALTNLATGITEAVNAYFWSAANGRFVGAVDTTDTPHDFGFTQVNIEGMFYGFGNPGQRDSIFGWLDGTRTVSGDTSVGADIYAWEFAPRTSTRKNSTWYNWIWPNSKRNQNFGDQVVDGGGVLYLTFYDVMVRLRHQGADSAYARLSAVTDWYAEVEQAGGYLAYYANRPGLVQGAIVEGEGEGGLGLHLEFTESTLVPTAFLYGFVGVDAEPGALVIGPRLPTSLTWAGVDDLHYRGAQWDVRVEREGPRISLTRRSAGTDTLELRLRHLAPETEYLVGAGTVVTTDAAGEASATVTLGPDQTLEVRPLADEPPPRFGRVLFSDNFLTTLTPPAATADLGSNQGFEGGRQTGELPETINPAGWSWTVSGQTSFPANNGWDLRAQENWPPSGPIDPFTLRFRHEVAGQWSTVTPNIGFSAFLVDGAFRMRVQVAHAHLETVEPPRNDRWAGLSFGAQPDVRFPAFAANGGVIVYPGGDYAVFANGAALATGNVPVPTNGVYALDLRWTALGGELFINGEQVEEDLDLSGITPAWIGVTVLPGVDPTLFSATQVRFDHFSVATLGELVGQSYAAWAEERWGGTVQGVSGPLNDPDGDGLVNLLEYVLGRDPMNPDADGALKFEQMTVNGEELNVLTYRQLDGVLDYVVFPQRSNDLNTWLPIQPDEVSAYFELIPAEEEAGATVAEWIAIDLDDPASQQRRFYRLRVQPVP